MKCIALLLLASPLFSLSQESIVGSATRVFPKQDKVVQFEKALAAHAKKYHTGDWAWTVFSIESGPDAGGYQLNEGPVTWEKIDSREDLGAAHTNDYMSTVAIYLTDRYSSNYSEFRADLSTVELTKLADNVQLNHVFPKPGYGPEVEALIKTLKPAWEAGQQSVAVFESSSSGAPQYVIATRYPQGLKERDKGFRATFKERYTKVNGEAGFNAYLETIKRTTDHTWSELLSRRADLGTK
jgi:hypothetical protein